VTEEMAPATEAMPAVSTSAAPTGKKLDINSRLAHLFRDGGWAKVEHVSDHASYEKDGNTVTARIQAEWALVRVSGERVHGTGAAALKLALEEEAA
jgi:hypothetical protein